MQLITSKNSLKLLLISMVVLSLATSCGTSRSVTTRILKPMSSGKLIKKIEKAVPDYKDYASKKVTVNLDTNGEKQSFTAQFKIKHNEFMIVTLRKISVPLGRAFISNDSIGVINYYDKNYVSGTVGDVQKAFGIEQIDFDLLQALFTADVNSILKDDFRDKEFISSIDGQLYTLESLYDRKIEKALANNDERKLERYKNRMDDNEFIKYVLWVDPEYFVIKKAEVHDIKNESLLTITYRDFKVMNRRLYPQEIVLNFDSDKQKMEAELSISKSDVNKEDNWSFSIPSKYDKFDAATLK